MRKILVILLCLLVIITTLENVESRRLSNSRKEKKEKKEKKEEKSDNEEEEDITEDLKNLELNATLSCFKCSGPSCIEASVKCNPGDICWKGKTVNGLYKGCASRLCNPVDIYSNVSLFTANICCIKDNCCARTRIKKGSKNVIVKPIKSTDFGNRGQIDLIDIRSLPDGGWFWILQDQDHTTKFCILRPLRCKEARGVAVELINIFSILGCPEILQSDNGKEFVAKIIKELKLLWPDLKIVNGRARHPQSQGSVERANGDLKQC
ncbi:unnamed protein product [Brachionus calyciflorus]|uniref:Integrase catalytic domain-containing protein n=1 Tax=Brachionus calyciflorus TaxID=104777 RepID=A0A813PAT7_9BILA|nr:unnamed protein product [Brachionus calyciflorus]